MRNKYKRGITVSSLVLYVILFFGITTFISIVYTNMNETMFKLIKNPLNLKSYTIEDLYIDISVLLDHFRGDATCHIELMSKYTIGSPIIVRYSGKEFKPNFDAKTIDPLDDKIMINKLLKPAIKNIFKPALKNVDTLIEFMTTNFASFSYYYYCS